MKWLHANRLSRNIHKIIFMAFRPKERNEICPPIDICGATIQEDDIAIFL